MSDLIKLHRKPLLRSVESITGHKSLTLDDRIKTIIQIIRELQTEGNFYYPGCDKKELWKEKNFDEFKKFIRLKYKTENGEIFTHPFWFNRFGGDCDCQTIYFLSHSKFFPYELRSGWDILILRKNDGVRNFNHITQCNNNKIFDFLPYKIPAGVNVIRNVRLN